MLDKEKRVAEYLAKAKEAQAIAGKFSPRDNESREKWQRIAEAYKVLAKAIQEL